jgi:hypothetical protein
LVLTATDRCFIDFTDAKDVGLRLYSVNDFQGVSINHVEKLLFSSNKEKVANDETVSHVFDVQSCKLGRVSTSEDVNFVFAVNCKDQLVIDLINVSCCLAVVLAVDDWS